MWNFVLQRFSDSSFLTVSVRRSGGLGSPVTNTIHDHCFDWSVCPRPISGVPPIRPRKVPIFSNQKIGYHCDWSHFDTSVPTRSPFRPGRPRPVTRTNTSTSVQV